MDHRKFCVALVQNLLGMNARVPHPHSIPGGRPKPEASQMIGLEA
jgi:hypothetical protein